MRTKVIPGRISATQACRWAGVKDGTHDTWVAQGLLEPTGGKGYDIDGLVRLFLFAKLVRAIGLERARRSWLRVRDELPTASDRPRYLKLVAGEAAPIAHLVGSLESLDAALSLGEAVRVIDLSPDIGKVIDWYETEVKAQWAAAGSTNTQLGPRENETDRANPREGGLRSLRQ